MKTLFSTLFNVMLRSVTIDKIEEFHCYSFDEGEIYVALTQPHSPILKTFPPQEDFFCWWQISVGRVPSQFALRSTFLVNIINTESTTSTWQMDTTAFSCRYKFGRCDTLTIYPYFVCQIRHHTECLSTEKRFFFKNKIPWFVLNLASKYKTDRQTIQRNLKKKKYPKNQVYFYD